QNSCAHLTFCDCVFCSVCSVNTDYRDERSAFSTCVVANVGQSSYTTASHTVVVCDNQFDFAFVSSQHSFHCFLSCFCIPVTYLCFANLFHCQTVSSCLFNTVLCTSDCFGVVR